jgi:outer membrane lipoprotein SlyB
LKTAERVRLLSRSVTLALTGFLLLPALSGCMRDYSPNTYSSAAAQQANKVTQGVVVGYREVMISADGTVGAVTGGAAGGVLGAQTPGSGVATALGTIGGTLLGGLVGTGVEHAAGDTHAFEYLVKQTDGSLVSVTQKDDQPLPVGEKVLVIAGNQARIVRDYSQPVPESSGAPAAAAAKDAQPMPAAPAGAAETGRAAPQPDERPAPAPADDAAASPALVGPPVSLRPGAPAPSGSAIEPAPQTEPAPEKNADPALPSN